MSVQLEKLTNKHRRSQALSFDFSPASLNLAIPRIFARMSSSLASTSGSSSKGEPDAKPRILYVDDEYNIAKVIKYGLEKYGFIVDVHTHPKSALSSFEPDVYDLLLIDVRLPEIDGLNLCNELLKIDDKVKVCFITAYELHEEEVRRRVSGLQTECIIKKPVTFDALVGRINSQLRRSD